MNILITGGAGYLGRGILRLAGPEDRFTIYSRDEQKQEACKRLFPTARYVIGDVRDPRFEDVAYGHDLIIHAAALKYVPEAEFNVQECIGVNIQGSLNVFRAARKAGVKRVVAISTDKAVRPVNVYGMTKALMERAAAELSTKDCLINCVRYGNVVGSTGSVVPLFQRQLADNGYIALTDPLMTRFWISIDEAVSLVRYAIGARGGAVIIPRPAAMTMGDLAAAIVERYGGREATVKIIGPRPGEKQHEELLHYQESGRVLLQDDYYTLLPITDRIEPSHEPFTLASHTPDRWMTKDEFIRLVEAA